MSRTFLALLLFILLTFGAFGHFVGHIIFVSDAETSAMAPRKARTKLADQIPKQTVNPPNKPADAKQEVKPKPLPVKDSCISTESEVAPGDCFVSAMYDEAKGTWTERRDACGRIVREPVSCRAIEKERPWMLYPIALRKDRKLWTSETSSARCDPRIRTRLQALERNGRMEEARKLRQQVGISLKMTTRAKQLKQPNPENCLLKPHTGIDIPAPIGEPILASYSGTVSAVFTERQNHACGNGITLAFDGGIIGTHCHMSRFSRGLRIGSRVSRGDIVGYVGQTGNADGPHDHFAIKMPHASAACKVSNGEVMNPWCLVWIYRWDPTVKAPRTLAAAPTVTRN